MHNTSIGIPDVLAFCFNPTVLYSKKIGEIQKYIGVRGLKQIIKKTIEINTIGSRRFKLKIDGHEQMI